MRSAAFSWYSSFRRLGSTLQLPPESIAGKDLANAIMSVIPAVMGQYIHIIFGILALPLGLCVGRAFLSFFVCYMHNEAFPSYCTIYKNDMMTWKSLRNLVKSVKNMLSETLPVTITH